MTPEEHAFIARITSNLWTFQHAFIGRLLCALKQSGALSDEALHELLEEVAEDTLAIEGEEDRQHATEILAAVRAALASL